MKLLAAAGLVLALCLPAAAQKAGDFGTGLYVGDPLGATAKYFLSDSNAVNLGLGVSEDFVLHGDFVHHIWQFSPQPKKGRISPYGAIGGRVEWKNYTDFGIRFMPGISYWPGMKRLFEVFVEVGPVLRLTRGTRGTIDGSVGLRYYFTSDGPKANN
jgi:hypothetical protein